MNYEGRPDALRKAIRKTGRAGGRQYGASNGALAEHYRKLWRDAAIDMAGIPGPDGTEYVGWVIPAAETAAIFDDAWNTAVKS